MRQDSVDDEKDVREDEDEKDRRQDEDGFFDAAQIEKDQNPKRHKFSDQLVRRQMRWQKRPQGVTSGSNRGEEP